VKTIILLITALLFNMSAMSLDDEIQNVKQASYQNRYELMNALKKRISLMNSSERSMAINQLRKNIATKNISKSIKHENSSAINHAQHQLKMQKHKDLGFTPPRDPSIGFQFGKKQKHP